VIHNLAVVHESAKIADNAIIGPFCVVGENVEIGEGTELKSHVTIGSNAVIGKNNRIFQYASIGDDPIDYTFKQDDFSKVIIGDNKYYPRMCNYTWWYFKRDWYHFNRK